MPLADASELEVHWPRRVDRDQWWSSALTWPRMYILRLEGLGVWVPRQAVCHQSGSCLLLPQCLPLSNEKNHTYSVRRQKIWQVAKYEKFRREPCLWQEFNGIIHSDWQAFIHTALMWLKETGPTAPVMFILTFLAVDSLGAQSSAECWTQERGGKRHPSLPSRIIAVTKAEYLLHARHYSEFFTSMIFISQIMIFFISSISVWVFLMVSTSLLKSSSVHASCLSLH